MHKVDIERLERQLRSSGFVSPILKTKFFFMSCLSKAAASFMFFYGPELLLLRSTSASILLIPWSILSLHPTWHKQYLTQLSYCLPFQPSSFTLLPGHDHFLFSSYLSSHFFTVLFPGSFTSSTFKPQFTKLTPETFIYTHTLGDITSSHDYADHYQMYVFSLNLFSEIHTQITTWLFHISIRISKRQQV